jgi:hypothetical protein
MKISECDFIFLSYDEPNADLHYSDLCNKIPWAKRIHGVKGSDAAHKAAADLAETDWLVTVDADNIVYENFFDVEFDDKNTDVKVYSWLAKNKINGLLYGNGGLKVWHKDFIKNMKSHEESVTDKASVDFCWEEGYKQIMSCYSDTIVTGSPFQAWRAGFREGVKMTLCDGVKVPPQEIKERVWWHNMHRLRIWSTVGAHEENGLYAVYGARLGTWLANCTDWNYVEVRDFEILGSIWRQYGYPYEEVRGEGLEDAIRHLGEKIKIELGLHWVDLDSTQSKYIYDLYYETIKMANTYYIR